LEEGAGEDLGGALKSWERRHERSECGFRVQNCYRWIDKRGAIEKKHTNMTPRSETNHAKTKERSMDVAMKSKKVRRCGMFFDGNIGLEGYQGSSNKGLKKPGYKKKGYVGSCWGVLRS